jgi:hypothetical protein
MKYSVGCAALPAVVWYCLNATLKTSPTPLLLSVLSAAACCDSRLQTPGLLQTASPAHFVAVVPLLSMTQRVSVVSICAYVGCQLSLGLQPSNAAVA